MPPEHHRVPSRGLVTKVVYSAIMCALVLLVVDLAARWLERSGAIRLETKDSNIVYLADSPYVREGDAYVTNPRVRDTMVASRFRAEKGRAWRMFVLGESFAMGTPYVHQEQAEPQPGGISSWLEADLAALYPDRPIEIINAAAGAQNSYRVRKVAEHVVTLEPDAILVAACNNEGVLPPKRIDEILHRSGGYRLLARLAMPFVMPEQRSYFTPQDPDLDAIRAAFETNLRAIVAAATEKRVPVLLATMPVHLRYRGEGIGHLHDNARDREAAEPEIGDCTRRARDRLAQGDPASAVEILRVCDPDIEGIRTLGLALYQTHQFDEAREILNLYTELAPRNRCRPSLNRIIREIAQSTPNVYLVDLERGAEALSPGGLPGDEMFVDYCHMNWAGYAAMADVIRAALDTHGVGPGGKSHPERLRPRSQLAAEFRLPELPEDYALRIANRR